MNDDEFRERVKREMRGEGGGPPGGDDDDDDFDPDGHGDGGGFHLCPSTVPWALLAARAVTALEVLVKVLAAVPEARELAESQRGTAALLRDEFDLLTEGLA